MKVLIIGSGPITIGQAAEFDYAGSQACRALREEGVETVLVNSTPSAIVTAPGVADITYIEPLTVEVLERIIAKERPDGLLPTLGGQTGLNLAVALAEAGVLGCPFSGPPFTRDPAGRSPRGVQAAADRPGRAGARVADGAHRGRGRRVRGACWVPARRSARVHAGRHRG